jgi:hypothetical protein
LAIAAATALALVVGPATTALASTYPSGGVGYDVGYPQCGGAYPGGAFGVIGVNGGYPFTYYNSCFAGEWAHALQTPSASVYINTGYDPSYTAIDGRHTTLDCAGRAAAVTGAGAQQQAWAVGCSEAERSIGWASCQSPASPSPCPTTIQPAAWWLDVETANSWCGQPSTACSDLTLNEFAIQGIVDTLHDQSASPVGVYSTASQWTTIVGPVQVTGITASWVATGMRSAKRARPSCQGPGFSGAPVWLVQFVPGAFDADYVC